MMLSLLTSQPRCSEDPPDAVQDLPGWVDPDVDIGHDDVVEVASFLVLEKCIRHPHLVRIRHRQVFYLTCHPLNFKNIFKINPFSNLLGSDRPDGGPANSDGMSIEHCTPK